MFNLYFAGNTRNDRNYWKEVKNKLTINSECFMSGHWLKNYEIHKIHRLNNEMNYCCDMELLIQIWYLYNVQSMELFIHIQIYIEKQCSTKIKIWNNCMKILNNVFIVIVVDRCPNNKGLSWWWSSSSWIYNYLCNQCLSPLKLWVRTPFMARCTRYIMW